MSASPVINPRRSRWIIHGIEDTFPHAARGGAPLACACGVRRPSSGDRAADFEWFETKVRPILVDHCYTCHSADTKPAGGLRVDDRNGLLAGGNSGPAVVPGDPAASLLLQRREPQEPQSADAQGGPTSDG